MKKQQEEQSTELSPQELELVQGGGEALAEGTANAIVGTAQGLSKGK